MSEASSRMRSFSCSLILSSSLILSANSSFAKAVGFNWYRRASYFSNCWTIILNELRVLTVEAERDDLFLGLDELVLLVCEALVLVEDI